MAAGLGQACQHPPACLAFIQTVSFKPGIALPQPRVVTIYSKLGSNCRIRVYEPLVARGASSLQKANGSNSNLFFAVADIQQPLVSAKAKLPTISLQKTVEYDLSTRPGGVYVLKGVK